MIAANENLPALSQIEWNAVVIALRDADRRAHEPARSRVGRFFDKAVAVLTGNEPATPLADPRLETLRRFVSGSRRHHRSDERTATELLEHGFSCAQLRAISLLAA